MIYLLDTSAVLIHYRQEAECERVLSLFDDPINEVLLSSVSLAEFGRVLRGTGQNSADIDAIIDGYLPLFARPCCRQSTLRYRRKTHGHPRISP